MVKITVNNSYSNIAGLSDKDKTELSLKLSYKNTSIEYSLKQVEKQIKYLYVKRTRCEIDAQVNEYDRKIKEKLKAERFLKHKLIVKLLDVKDGSFPTGLLTMVKKYLDISKIPYSISDKRKKPKKTLYLRDLIEEPPLRYYQTEAIDLCIAKSRETIESATGTGKTRMINEVIKRLGVPTLIICPTNNIVVQTAETLALKFGGKHVGTIGDNKKDLNKNITVACVMSLPNLDDDWFKRIHCLIIDEVHHSAAETYQELNKNSFSSIYHRFCFSGTVFRNDGADLALLGVTNDIGYRYSALQGIRDGYLARPVFYIINNKVQPHFSKMPYKTAYRTRIVENQRRNDLIASRAIKMASAGKSVLILVDEIKHGKLIGKLLEGANYKFISSMTKSNIKVIHKFNNKEIDILIGTSVIGEGVDTKITDILFIAGAGKAKSNIIQKIGRALRIAPSKKHAIIIDFSDNGNFIFENQAKQRQNIYREYHTLIEHI